jgi:hypothetical protein
MHKLKFVQSWTKSRSVPVLALFQHHCWYSSQVHSCC